MKLKIFKVFLPIILLVSSFFPMLYAPWTDVSPIDETDDAFITGTGNYFGDTPYLFLRDQTTDLLIGTRFRNLAIAQGNKINNATLFVRSVYDYPAAGDISVTIYGDDVDSSIAFNDSGSFTRTYTESFVNWNISLINGNAWHNVTVTNIVQEIIDRPEWISGNDLSLIILCAKGIPRREFASVDGNPAYTAHIEINYGIPPTPDEVEDIADEAETPYNDTDEYIWEYEDTYRGIDIYNVTQIGAPEFQYVFFDDVNTAYYHNSSTGVAGAIQIDENWQHAVASGATSPILSLGQWTLIMGDPNSTWIFISDDEFVTNTSYDPNDQYNLATFGGNIGSIAVDRQIDNLIHVVWTSVTPGQPAVYNVIYTNFTLDMVTGIPTFAPTYTNITTRGTNQFEPVIHVQENGTLHVVWYAVSGTNEEQIWYRRRHDNGTWFNIVRVSDTDVPGDQHAYPDVIANKDTGIALVVWEFDRTDVYWDVVFPNNTDDVDRLANTGVVPSMVMDRDRNEALMVWSSALGQPATIYFQNKTITNSSAWSANKQVSPGGEKHFMPDIGIETLNGTIQVIWQNDWNLQVAGNFWDILDDPVPKKTTISNVHGRHNFIEEEFNLQVLGTWQFLVYPNGTLVDTDPLPEGVDPEDAIDDLLGGAQPEDPEPDEYTVIDKFRWKLLVLAVGMIMLLGSPIAGITYGAGTATWIKLLFIMFFGLGILWQIKFM